LANSFQVAFGISYMAYHTSTHLQFIAATGGQVNEQVTIDSTGVSPSISVGMRF
jgi:hypothetical protein